MSNDEALFADARVRVDRQAFSSLLLATGRSAVDATARAAAREEFNAQTALLDEGAYRLARTALAGAHGPPVSTITSTVWQRVDQTYGGIACSGTWSEYGAWHRALAHVVAPKGEGIAYSPTVNRDGHRCNASTLRMTALNLDADGTGGWDDLWQVILEAGFAALAHQSGGHADAAPKWRLILPLASPFDTSSPERVTAWRSAYLTARTVFGALARLRGPGFDPTTDGPHHPWYPGFRRSHGDPPREVRQTTGATLDLHALLAQLPAPNAARETRDLRREQEWRSTTDLGTPDTLLGLAFREAGMLGRSLGHGKFAVICPWNEGHTKPLTGDLEATSATVIWPASSAANIGGFSCAHTCGSPPVEDVLEALPADAVMRALELHTRGDDARTQDQPARFDAEIPRLTLRIPGVPR